MQQVDGSGTAGVLVESKVMSSKEKSFPEKAVVAVPKLQVRTVYSHAAFVLWHETCSHVNGIDLQFQFGRAPRATQHGWPFIDRR